MLTHLRQCARRVVRFPQGGKTIALPLRLALRCLLVAPWRRL